MHIEESCEILTPTVIIYSGVSPNMSAKEGANTFTSLLIFSAVVDVPGLSTSA